MSDKLRSVGRGGAGNFIIPQDDNDEAARPANAQVQDPEAEKPPAVARVPAQSQPYARVGRGGAGNFYDPTVVPTEPDEDGPDGTGTAVAAQSATWAGRGGLGNWSGTTPPATQQDSEARKEEELADKVVRNVDAELSVPPKIYASPRKDGV